MNDASMRTLKGAGLVLLLGLLIVGAVFFGLPLLNKHQSITTSDGGATKGRILIGKDSFIGYFPLCSKRMQTRMLAEGYELVCVDEPDFAKRFAKLQSGELPIAVGTLDPYLLKGGAYPGVIPIVIDASHGGDAIVARQSVVANLDQLKTKPNLRIAFTPDSPSDHLLKAAAVHFDIPWLRDRRGGWPAETVSSAEALKLLVAGSTDVAVLWEPDVSVALAQGGMVRLLDTSQTENLVVDALFVGRDYAQANKAVLDLFLTSYFKTLKEYRDHPELLEQEVIAEQKLPVAQVREMLKGVRWYSMQENATFWFGLGASGSLPNFGLKDAIENTIHILTDYGSITGNPLPDGDWRRIVLSEPLARLYAANVLGTDTSKGDIAPTFPPLDEKGWGKLTPVGTLKIRPIVFQSGKSELSLGDKEEIDAIMLDLQNYPRFRILVEGHTKPGGNEADNVSLSSARAQAVMTYLIVAHSIDANRVRAQGMGSSQSLTQEPGETYRAFMDRLARVDIHLMQEESY